MAFIQGDGRPDRQVVASKIHDPANRVAAMKLPKNTIIKDVFGKTLFLGQLLRVGDYVERVPHRGLRSGKDDS